MSSYNDILNAFNALTNDNNVSNDNSNDNNAPQGAVSSTNPIDAIICQICRCGDNEDTLLLCDGCETAMHTGCLNMRMIPPGDWYCARCQRAGAGTQARAPKKGDYVYLYERVSSKGQNAPEYGRVGMDTQNHQLMKYCFERNMTIRGTFLDVGSGRDVEKLRDFRKMVNQMPRGTCVMIYSVSRFGRNLGQVQEYLNVLHQKGCYVYSVTEGVSSFDQRFLDLVVQAQHESQQLSVTMRNSVARRRQEGQWIGPAPFGFEVYRDNQNRRLVRPLTNHPEVVGRNFLNQRNLTDRQIWEQLEAANVQPRTGTWSLARVRNMRNRIRQAYDTLN